MRNAKIEISVGVFMICAFIALFFLAMKVSGLTQFAQTDYYTVQADFNNIGDLKVRAPVSIAGVRVGQVSAIKLNPVTFQAMVNIRIDTADNKIPSDTQASILTQGILGSNYIGLTPGYADTFLKSGSQITDTHSALILENLIGQFLFNAKKD